MSFIARKVGRKVAGNKLAAYEPEDPHYGQSSHQPQTLRIRYDVLTGERTCRGVRGQEGTQTAQEARHARGTEQARRAHPRKWRSNACCRSGACPCTVVLITYYTALRPPPRTLPRQGLLHLRVPIRLDRNPRIDPVRQAARSQTPYLLTNSVAGRCSGAGDIAQFLLGYSLVLRKCRDAE